jgi:xanthine dehydrogenase accessory factor
MGQCCGGVVRLLLECFSAAERPVLRELAALPGPVVLAHPLAGGVPLVCAAPPASPATSPTAADGKIVLGLSADKTHFLACRDLPRRPAFVSGAGHIGRALVGILASLDLDVHWIDIRPNRFPAVIPDGVRRVIAADPSMIAGHAPPDAIHLVITHNHALDQAICYKLLAGDGFARLGLIGSATKSARFRQRLTRAGISRDRLDRLVCPIGIPAITGKQPARVALSIAARVAIWQQELDITHNSRDHIAAPVTA